MKTIMKPIISFVRLERPLMCCIMVLFSRKVDEKRRIYDQYGEQSLKEGIVAQDGRRDVGNYVLTTQP
jgi:hypothetical protein